MKCGILLGQKKQTLDRASRRTVAWVLGRRDVATFQRLYDKVSHLTTCTFFTDDWNAFSKVLPPNRHIIEKAGTTTT